MATSYQRKSREKQRDEVRESLEAYVTEEAEKMLAAALEEEVTRPIMFLGFYRIAGPLLHTP